MFRCAYRSRHEHERENARTHSLSLFDARKHIRTQVCDFPSIHPDRDGKQCQYMYAVTRCTILVSSNYALASLPNMCRHTHTHTYTHTYTHTQLITCEYLQVLASVHGFDKRDVTATTLREASPFKS